MTLVHEHVLVDFVGAAEVGRHRYEADDRSPRQRRAPAARGQPRATPRSIRL